MTWTVLQHVEEPYRFARFARCARSRAALAPSFHKISVALCGSLCLPVPLCGAKYLHIGSKKSTQHPPKSTPEPSKIHPKTFPNPP